MIASWWRRQAPTHRGRYVVRRRTPTGRSFTSADPFGPWGRRCSGIAGVSVGHDRAVVDREGQVREVRGLLERGTLEIGRPALDREPTEFTRSLRIERASNEPVEVYSLWICSVPSVLGC
jgi:hypothetical protein